MLFFAPCKINIGLDILARRADGFHEIRTVMFPVRGLCDALEILPAHDTELIMSGVPVDGRTEDNLCMRAWRLMRERYGIAPVRMRLHKTIPTGAGLGGGSADGTFTLCGLNALFGLGLDASTLESLAAGLGSDMPFFVRNQPALASGRGEILEPYPLAELSGKWLVVVKPDVAISTREAYAGVRPFVPREALAERLRTPIENWRETIENAFEAPLFERRPRLADIKRRLYDMGALYASLSGSGSSLYGIFDRPANCSRVFIESFVYQELIT